MERPGRSLDARARELVVTELYRRSEISRGKAAQQLAMSLDEFLRHTSALGIPYVDYTEEEWEDEKRSIQEIAATLGIRTAPPVIDAATTSADRVGR